jgi:hypothetical protein
MILTKPTRVLLVLRVKDVGSVNSNMMPEFGGEIFKGVGIEIIVDRVLKFGKWAFDSAGNALVTPHLEKIQSAV